MVAEVTSPVEVVSNPKSASTLSAAEPNENGKSTHLVQVTSVKSVELSQDRAVRVKSFNFSKFWLVANFC